MLHYIEDYIDYSVRFRRRPSTPCKVNEKLLSGCFVNTIVMPGCSRLHAGCSRLHAGCMHLQPASDVCRRLQVAAGCMQDAAGCMQPACSLHAACMPVWHWHNMYGQRLNMLASGLHARSMPASILTALSAAARNIFSIFYIKNFMTLAINIA